MRQVVATKGWQLTKKEIKALDKASRQRGYCKAATNWFWGRHPLLRNLRQWMSNPDASPLVLGICGPPGPTHLVFRADVLSISYEKFEKNVFSLFPFLFVVK